MVLLVIDAQSGITNEKLGFFNSFMWKNRYAECVTMDEALELIERG